MEQQTNKTPMDGSDYGYAAFQRGDARDYIHDLDFLRFVSSLVSMQDERAAADAADVRQAVHDWLAGWDCGYADARIGAALDAAGQALDDVGQASGAAGANVAALDDLGADALAADDAADDEAGRLDKLDAAFHAADAFRAGRPCNPHHHYATAKWIKTRPQAARRGLMRIWRGVWRELQAQYDDGDARADAASY